ncbi:hypothetical protein [Rhodococcus sp. (in: high G+C Gram-positive bacteria)]|uniref:hypothetical protein n=1 Tax=Rhodococcus sp. TaxID=1831 RepID=UPI0038903CF5
MTTLRDRISAALTPFVQLRTPGAEDNGDGSFGFDYGAVPFALQVVTLTEGLDVVSLTGVLAWDLPLGDEVRIRVASAAEALQFGSIHVIERESVADVIVRYSFPATGLEDSPLTTMLLLVLDGVAEARDNVAGTSGTGSA